MHATMTPSIRSAHPSRRGAISKGCLIGLACAGVLLLLALIFGSTIVSTYNGLGRGKEDAAAKWAAIDSQYKRRFDLIPNLVETVKGAANFEQKTLTDIAEARASVGRAQLPPGLPTDDAQLKAYIQAQQGLGGALARLLVVSENYPQLRATEAFRDLQSQLEGTENRIQVARRDYIDSIKDYNSRLATFPGNVIGGFFNFQRLPQLEIPSEERATPKVDFGSGTKPK
jgi:LemA protein